MSGAAHNFSNSGQKSPNAAGTQYCEAIERLHGVDIAYLCLSNGKRCRVLDVLMLFKKLFPEQDPMTIFGRIADSKKMRFAGCWNSDTLNRRWMAVRSVEDMIFDIAHPDICPEIFSLDEKLRVRDWAADSGEWSAILTDAYALKLEPRKLFCYNREKYLKPNTVKVDTNPLKRKQPEESREQKAEPEESKESKTESDEIKKLNEQWQKDMEKIKKMYTQMLTDAERSHAELRKNVMRALVELPNVGPDVGTEEVPLDVDSMSDHISALHSDADLLALLQNKVAPMEEYQFL